jgi:hypothetical protein
MEPEDPANGYTNHQLSTFAADGWYTVGLQLWQLPGPAEAEAHLRLIAGELPTEAPIDPSTLVGQLQGTWLVAFVDPARHVVAALHCGVDQCTSREMALALATAIRDRLAD